MDFDKYEIAYFSAEIGLFSKLPTYSGGLGILAGDHIKSAADIGLPLVAVSLLYKEGYFEQKIDKHGHQLETYSKIDPLSVLKKINSVFVLELMNRKIYFEVYYYNYLGIKGHIVPIYFIDTDIGENILEDRMITLRLYSGDKNHRILQEALLGYGGMKLLSKLTINNIKTYHMNEGHCSFLTLYLYNKYNQNKNKVRNVCHFTTHTPVSAGHDQFSISRVKNILNELLPDNLNLPNIIKNNKIHMTELGLYFSRSANGVSKLHGKIAQNQFPEFKINYITNGVYHPYWIGESFHDLYDKRLSGWRKNPRILLNINLITDQELDTIHFNQKNILLNYINEKTQNKISENILTIGFARRATEYKRINLIFQDLDRLINICKGKVQFVFAGKAHPNDNKGKKLIKNVVMNASKLTNNIKIIYLENYNMYLGKIITSGVDVWLNTPLKPNEASGTSGMKAALNGIPNFSIPDGWWAEGCNHEINGWSIGNGEFKNDKADSMILYDILENSIIPLYYNDKVKWRLLMREAIKTGVKFTSHRMIKDYIEKVY